MSLVGSSGRKTEERHFGWRTMLRQQEATVIDHALASAFDHERANASLPVANHYTRQAAVESYETPRP